MTRVCATWTVRRHRRQTRVASQAAAAAAELVGLHGDVDADRAALHAAWPTRPSDPSAIPDVLGPGPRVRLLRDQPRPRLGGGRRALRQPAQRLLAAAARRRLHAAPLRPAGAVRPARARLRRHERRRPHDARLGRPAPRRLRPAAPRAARARADARARSPSSARRPTAVSSTSGPSSARSCGRSRPAPASSSCRRPRRRTPPCPTRSGCAGSASCAPGSSRSRARAVRAIVLDAGDRVLLCEFTNEVTGARWWGTPGGGIEPGESDEEALRRELLEEAGLDRLRARPGRARARPRLPLGRGGSCASTQRFHLVRVDAPRARADDRPRARGRRRPALVDARRARAAAAGGGRAAAPSPGAARTAPRTLTSDARRARHDPPARRGGLGRRLDRARLRRACPRCRRSRARPAGAR